MPTVQMLIIRIFLGVALGISGWVMMTKAEWVNDVFGMPLFNRTALMKENNLAHSRVLGFAVFVAGIVIVSHSVLAAFSRH